MFIDIHHHLVHGVDDGAESFEATMKMLRRAHADGISYLITTPHMVPGEAPFPFEDYYRNLAMAQEFCRQEEIPIQLYDGAEILYTDETPRFLREKKLLTLAGSRFVLLEFLPTDSFERLYEAAWQVAGLGYVPIFAHIERYECLKKIEQLEQLRMEFDIRIQVNARTLLRKNGYFRDRWIQHIFEADQVDYVATDAHDLPGRHARMMEGYRVLSGMLGAEKAYTLVAENQMEIFQ